MIKKCLPGPIVAPPPTIYDGVQFRSRLEARWAVYFDVIGLDWEYEFEEYHLFSGQILPTFWLPQVDLWAEVTPKPFNDLDLAILEELVLRTQVGCLMLCGSPRATTVNLLEPLDGKTQVIDAVISMYKGYPVDLQRFYVMAEFYDVPIDGGFDDVHEAASAARSERFYHPTRRVTPAAGPQ